MTLHYPWLHVALAPLTLPADWLNGGSRHDLIAFVLWTVVGYVLARMAWRAPGWKREAAYAVLFAAAVAGFFAWAAFAPRPIPRLVAGDPDVLVWDAHSHTAASHDGRAGFDAAQNARWHARAGFGAAFVTDHNTRAELVTGTDGGAVPLLLGGEELSLAGLHLLVLGTDTTIANAPWNSSWDSTLMLIRLLAPGTAAETTIHHPPSTLLVASLPEYWRYHWGEDLSRLVTAGVRGFEIWTSSPKAMELPEHARRHIVARARASNLVLLGGTDMHGLGRTASVWNVTLLPGWRALPPAAVQAALLAKLTAEGFAANRVVARRRWLPGSRLGQALAVPGNMLLLPRQASWGHALALLGWLWLGVGLSARRRRPSA